MTKGKAKDKRGAMGALRKMKLRQKELDKLEGQKIMLENQVNAINNAGFDQGIFAAMKEGNQALTNVQN